MILPRTSRSQLKALLLSALKWSVRNDWGATMVETAISISTLLILIFAVIEASMTVYSFHFVANAAHEATRYAIVRGASWSTSCDGTGTAGSGYGTSMCQASTADVANYVANRNFPGINITAADVCVQYSATVPASSSETCSNGSGSTNNAPGDIVQVTVSYPFTINIPFLPALTVPMSSTSQMAIAQ